MKRIIRLTERDLSRIVKRTIMEMESDDLQSQFENMVDEIGDQVIEDSFYGELTEDDMEGFASIVSDLVNDKIQEINPNMKVDYTIYHGGDLEFFIFDNDQEEIVATYRPDF
jgi:ATP-dependent RNA circularization protein (DNA/RNA ligase family)